jgi:predicted TIM-barrel fold metal-dependent hydrolase
LKYVCDYLGPERIIFGVEYPYETIDNACGWWDGDAEEINLGGKEAYMKVGRENAKKLLKLGSTMIRMRRSRARLRTLFGEYSGIDECVMV